MDDLNYMNINWHDVAQTSFNAVPELLWEPITSVNTGRMSADLTSPVEWLTTEANALNSQDNTINIGFAEEPVLRWFYKPSDDIPHYKQKECCPSESLLKIVDNMFNGGGG